MRPTAVRTARTMFCVLGVALVVTGCGPTGPGPEASGGPAPGAAPSAGSSTGPATGPATGSATGPASAPAGPEGINLVADGYAGRFRAWATVLEKGGGGPQLCLGAIATSYPPQCGGPPVAGWDWAKVEHDEAARVRWGAYVVVGRYDGTRFTLTEPAEVDDGKGPRPDAPALPDFRSPCPAPSGGWVPVDPAKATDDAQQQAIAIAEQQPGYAALWLDQNEAAATGGPSTTRDNDPTRIVLNVSTTGDVAAMERALRAVWGGNLCVSKGRRTNAELARVQAALEQTPGILTSSPDEIDGWVDLTVVLATTSLQRRLDATHGPGVVRLIGALAPID